MNAPRTRRTLSSLLLGSLLLCAEPKPASSQQNEDAAKQEERIVQTCFTAPAQQALPACELIATALSQRPDSPVEDRIAINARLSDVLVELERYAEAEAPARKAVAAAQEAKKQSTIGAQQSRLATVLKYLGRYSEAEALFRNATKLAKKEYGAEAAQVTAAMGHLAEVLQAQGKHEEAKSLYRKSLAILEKKLAPDHLDISITRNNFALVLQAQGKHEEAESLYRKSLAIFEKKLAPNHPGLAKILGNLAEVLQPQGKLVEAESLYRKSLAIIERHLGPDYLDLARTLGNFALVLRAQGKLVEAESLLRKSLAIDQKKLAPDHPDLAKSLGNLALVLQDQGKLVEAESLFRKSLAIDEKKLAPDHPDLAKSLGNLALVLQDQGKLVEAESLLRKSLAIDEKRLAPDHPDLAKSLGYLALVLYGQRELAEAESLFRRCLDIGEKKQDAAFIAITLDNLALVLAARGKLDEAESLFRKSLKMEEKKLVPDHLDLAKTFGNLALVLNAQGKLVEAEALFCKSLAIFKEKLAPDHPNLAMIHFNLSLLRLAQGHVKEALTEQEMHIQSFDQLLRSSSTEDQAEALLASHRAEETVLYGLPLLPGAPQEADRLAMSTAMLLKGRTLEAGRMVRRELQQGLKTEVQQKKYQTMLALLEHRDQELTRMAQGSGDRKTAQELLWKAQKLERELSEEVGAQSSADVPALADVTHKVSQSLPQNAVLIEFGLGQTADYRRPADWQTTITYHYVAMMVFPSGEVRVVRLGGKDDVEDAIKAFLAALSKPSSDIEKADKPSSDIKKADKPSSDIEKADKPSSDIEQAAKSAYAKLFAPLERELSGVGQVILSPDGALSAIPFGALHDDKGYLADRLSFRYVSSGRDLLNQPRQKPTTQPAVMMATRVPGQDALVAAEKAGQEIAQTQGAKLTEGATDGQVLVQQSPSVLTLISHGYFGGGSKEGGMSARLSTRPKRMLLSKYMGQMGFERDIAPQAQLVMAEHEKTEELMNSSGLMMTPGLQASTDTKQDGRLTAVEVREMNLQGTKLVMLLACKGAAGGLSFGQGVYGLRRAVLQAGAETVVGTLWSVEEKSASELAKKYMTKLWTDKKATRVGAMEESMKEMRNDKDHPEYRHPHYWAPFVVMGMDGPLQNPL